MVTTVNAHEESKRLELGQEFLSRTSMSCPACNCPMFLMVSIHVEELTPRELEVLALLAAGYTNWQIGLALSITGSTTENHLHHIFRKLGVTTRVQAARYAWDHGITPQKQDQE